MDELTHVAQVRAQIDRAQHEIGEVCAEGPSRRFRMSIPANPGRDTDLLISDALTAAGKLLDAALDERDQLRTLAERLYTDGWVEHDYYSPRCRERVGPSPRRSLGFLTGKPRVHPPCDACALAEELGGALGEHGPERG